MPPMSATRMRLERLSDERERTNEKIEDRLRLAEDEQRSLNELEQQDLTAYRQQVADLDEEIGLLAGDLERNEKTRDVSALLRAGEKPEPGEGAGVVVYRTFAQYARDELIVRYPQLAAQAAEHGDVDVVLGQARERLAAAKLRVQNTLTSNVAGLLPTQYLTQILDLINSTRPVSASGRTVPLDRGKLSYPRILSRPTVLKQTAEKTEAGTGQLSVTMDQINADTYLGGGDLSWQTITWSSPDALALWFELAAEAYAQQTESAACSELGTAGGGTIATPLGTTGTESFQQWRAAVLQGLKTIYAQTGGRAQTDVLWLSADRFFALAGVGTDQILQVSPVGNLDVGAMTGTWSGLRVIGTYGFGSPSSAAVLGDASAFLVGETQGAPVELRAVEPNIGGMQVGVIGAYKAKVFDSNRFIHLS